MSATTVSLSAAGHTDAGLEREVNEDRFYCNPARGLFIVIDGVGGQAAGGKAAEVALDMLRDRLERETRATDEGVREAITIANNEIYRLARMRSEWNGMACVLTVVVIENDQAVVGHVGDTRLYKLRRESLEKITRDHSPVGEREDADELSESEAMRHPRRNEVYRDVGSEAHQPLDPEFVDVHRITFEKDAALLLCSDGLSDLVPSAAINQIVKTCAGHPDRVARALVDAANEAGGKDNVTVVYVEGEQFAASRAPHVSHPLWRRRLVRAAVLALVLAIAGMAFYRTSWPGALALWPPLAAMPSIGDNQVVQPTGSIGEAIARAKAGSQIFVEPGEYREQIRMRADVRVVSRVPRGATIRLPAASAETEAAVIAADLAGAELVGFRIVGDVATPLGTGVLIRNAVVALVDVEISGATVAAIDVSGGAGASVVASDVHDNPGAAIAVRSGATPRVVHNVFARNGTSGHVSTSILVDPDAQPLFQRNVFRGIRPEALSALGTATRAELMRDNWFPQ